VDKSPFILFQGAAMRAQTKTIAEFHPESRLIRLPEVSRLTGFQKSKLYAMIAAGTFPRFLKIANCRASLWDAAAVERWVADVIKQGGAL
jgi:prophage regulatory protein